MLKKKSVTILRNGIANNKKANMQFNCQAAVKISVLILNTKAFMKTFYE